MEGVARLTMMLRGQTLNYTENKLATSFSRASHPNFSSNYVRFGANARKRRAENVGAGLVAHLFAVYGGYVRLWCVAGDPMLCTAVL